MVQRERTNIAHSGHTTIVHLFKGSNQMEMKKPIELWQAILYTIGTTIAVISIAINVSNKLTDQEARIRALESSIDKIMHRFDKIEEKQDSHNEKTNQILILIQNKADRK